MLDQYSESGSPLLFDLVMENKIRSWTNITKKLDIYIKKKLDQYSKSGSPLLFGLALV